MKGVQTRTMTICTEAKINERTMHHNAGLGCVLHEEAMLQSGEYNESSATPNTPVLSVHNATACTRVFHILHHTPKFPMQLCNCLKQQKHCDEARMVRAVMRLCSGMTTTSRLKALPTLNHLIVVTTTLIHHFEPQL